MDQEILIPYVQNILFALIIFVVGKWLARMITNFTRKIMTSRKVDKTLVSFGCNVLYAILFILVVVAALTRLGVQTASMVAVIGAATLAVGLALQGSLGNLASGVLIIMLRPFKIGDVIEAAGKIGVVKDIQILSTTLTTPDNRVVHIPNGAVMGGAITNVTANETRRVDMVFGISYDDDIDKARDIIKSVLDANEKILKEPAYTVAVNELADSSVNFVVRPWSKTSDYWAVFFAVTENVKKSFDEQGISIPFPQQDVHMYQEKKAE